MFQKDHKVYYKANRDIPAGRELYVGYCKDYNQDFVPNEQGSILFFDS